MLLSNEMDTESVDPLSIVKLHVLNTVSLLSLPPEERKWGLSLRVLRLLIYFIIRSKIGLRITTMLFSSPCSCARIVAATIP